MNEQIPKWNIYDTVTSVENCLKVYEKLDDSEACKKAGAVIVPEALFRDLLVTLTLVRDSLDKIKSMT